MAGVTMKVRLARDIFTRIIDPKRLIFGNKSFVIFLLKHEQSCQMQIRVNRQKCPWPLFEMSRSCVNGDTKEMAFCKSDKVPKEKSDRRV